MVTYGCQVEQGEQIGYYSDESVKTRKLRSVFDARPINSLYDSPRRIKLADPRTTMMTLIWLMPGFHLRVRTQADGQKHIPTDQV